MGVVRTKPGVQFTIIAPAGFRILAALEQTARSLETDLMITSACDGAHSGPTDPHKRGVAYDVRLRDFAVDQQQTILRTLMLGLADGYQDAPAEISGGLATDLFFGQIEDPDGENHHLHVQLRKARSYGVIQ